MARRLEAQGSGTSRPGMKILLPAEGARLRAGREAQPAPEQELGPMIGLLALSAIPDDPRVRRQGDAFTSAGWQVRAFGLSGGVSELPGWPVHEVAPPGSTE